MCGEKGFKAVHEAVHNQVKFIGKGFSIFQSSAYATLLSTTGYCIVPDSFGIYLAAQQQNKLINFRFVLMLVCFSAQVFCHRLARNTYKLYFLFNNFGFRLLNSHVMFRCIECYRTKTEPGIRFQQPSLIKSLYFLIYFSYLDLACVAGAKMGGRGFPVAGLDRAKLGFYRFQFFLFIVVMVISILLKAAF